MSRKKMYKSQKKYSSIYLSTACRDGYYGSDCLKQCSDNCLTAGRCDKETGECEGGCQTGWKKPTCDSSKNVKAKYELLIQYTQKPDLVSGKKISKLSYERFIKLPLLGHA